MAKLRGKFIVLDGVDGSGKGTQAKRLAQYFFDRDKASHVLLTREPFISKYYQEIRTVLRDSKNPRDNAVRLAQLFVKDRKVHTKIIEGLLAAGIDVVSDRYKYSTLAYQQTQGLSFSELLKMHKGVLVPDLAVILDVPVEVALTRIAEDSGRAYKEVFEKKDFQAALRDNFLALPKQLPNENIVVIDASKSVDKVSEEIRQEVEKLAA